MNTRRLSSLRRAVRTVLAVFASFSALWALNWLSPYAAERNTDGYYAIRVPAVPLAPWQSPVWVLCAGACLMMTLAMGATRRRTVAVPHRPKLGKKSGEPPSRRRLA